MNEVGYVLLGMCLGGFAATLYFNVEIGKHCVKMVLLGKEIQKVAFDVERIGATYESSKIYNLSNEIIKECE